MVDPKVVSDWLNKAEEDFLYALASLEDELPFYAQISFHFQQAAEKYLKAYIVAKELEFRKIHNLLILLKTCVEYDHSFDQLHEDCEILNRYYVDTRYPVHWPTHHTEDSATKAKDAADRIRNFVKEKLKHIR
jgi:HEPN domain-containing protein